MRNGKSVACVALAGAALLTLAGSAQASQWLSFDVPDGNGTYATKISGHDEIIGRTNSRKLFTRTKDGTIFTFGNPDDEVAAINSQGIVTGNTTSDGMHFHGFYMGPDQQIHPFDVPGSNGTFPAAINRRGDIAGQSSVGAFIRHADGTFETNDSQPSLTALNDRDWVAGAYSNLNIFISNWSLHKGGIYNLPHSSGAILVASLNNSNAAAGSFNDISGVRHGFLVQPSQIVTFDAPGSTATFVTGMNDDGNIVGYYSDANQIYHGFTRTPDGTIKSFDAPGANSTFFMGIAPNGKVSGYYNDSNYVAHGLRLNAKAAGF